MIRTLISRWLGLLAVMGVLAGGCQTCPVDGVTSVPDVPRELCMTTHPPYTVAAPDILLIDAIRVIPIPPYHLSPLDTIAVSVARGLPNNPLQGMFTIEPDGGVNFGPDYGKVMVADLTVEEARVEIEKHLRNVIKIANPEVTVTLAQFRGMQQIRGEHMVGPDGTVRLGLYGSVVVAGMTLDEAKAAIEKHLSKYLLRPEVSVDVFAYNSKQVYVITDGGGYGEQIVPLPATGNETVLDAVAKAGGLPAVASKRRIWVARPAPAGHTPDQILPVNWDALARGGNTTTNYQLLPGDRVYVMAEPLVTFDTAVARLLSPFERLFGFTLLGNSAVRELQGGQNSQGLGAR